MRDFINNIKFKIRNEKKLKGLLLIITAIVVMAAALIIFIPSKGAEKTDKDKNKDKTHKTVVADTGKKDKNAEFMSEKNFGFVHFFDVASASESESQQKRLEKELKKFMKENGITDFTIKADEPFDYVEGEKPVSKNDELAVSVNNGVITEDFHFTLIDQNGTEYDCSYSIYDDSYTFGKKMTEKEAGEVGIGSAEEDDPRDAIHVDIIDKVKTGAEEAGIKIEDLEKAARDCVNDNGYLGLVNEVTIATIDRAEDNSVYFTGFFDDEDGTPCSFIYAKGVLMGAVGE